MVAPTFPALFRDPIGKVRSDQFPLFGSVALDQVPKLLIFHGSPGALQNDAFLQLAAYFESVLAVLTHTYGFAAATFLFNPLKGRRGHGRLAF